jgi:hypothetical protein
MRVNQWGLGFSPALAHMLDKEVESAEICENPWQIFNGF